MSPGATFERVYNELKRMLADGELPLGSPIEPALIGKQIASSITPIRDALHRLTGERLVEAPNHNGFRVPLPTESALRDLYHWNGLILGIAVKQLPPGFRIGGVADPGTDADIATLTTALLLMIAQATGSAELVKTVESLNDRLATFRRAEAAVLKSVREELSGLIKVSASGDRAALTAALTRYHRRRVVAVVNIFASLAPPVGGR